MPRRAQMFAMFARECGIWFSCLNVAVRTANIANIGFLTGNAHIGQIEKELSLVEGARDSGEVPERCAPLQRTTAALRRGRRSLKSGGASLGNLSRIARSLHEG